MHGGEADSSGQDYPWYALVRDNTLEQGDLLERFPLLIASALPEPTEEGVAFGAIIREHNVLILTQSCDLVQGKVESVLLCPSFSLEDLVPSFPELASRKGRERIKQGTVPSLHLIPPCPINGHVRGARIVNFRQIATMPFDLVRGHAARQPARVRLLPPYREHLAQAFARFVMRVGLPVDFPDL